jgi:nucleoside 2-deoxyribosyltransferase
LKLYVAGPMRGYELHNFPAFDAVAAALRDQGHTVFNPADHDREIGFEATTVEVPEGTLHQMMRWDLARVMEVDGVVFLPGWEKSKGACAERVVAHYIGIACYDLGDDGALVPQSTYMEPIVLWDRKLA